MADKLKARKLQKELYDKLKDTNIYFEGVDRPGSIGERLLPEYGNWIDDEGVVSIYNNFLPFLDANGKVKTDFKNICALSKFCIEEEQFHALVITPEGNFVFLLLDD